MAWACAEDLSVTGSTVNRAGLNVNGAKRSRHFVLLHQVTGAMLRDRGSVSFHR